MLPTEVSIGALRVSKTVSLFKLKRFPMLLRAGRLILDKVLAPSTMKLPLICSRVLSSTTVTSTPMIRSPSRVLHEAIFCRSPLPAMVLLLAEHAVFVWAATKPATARVDRIRFLTNIV